MNLIVAMSRNFVIGRSGKLPWILPAELKRFKEITTGHAVVMGRRTYESIGRPLPGRENIVLSSTLSDSIAGVKVFKSFPECLAYLKSIHDGREVFIIGGAEIYKLFLPFIKKMYVTTVDVEVNGDDVTRFPDFDLTTNVLENKFHEKDEKNRFNYRTGIMEVV